MNREEKEKKITEQCKKNRCSICKLKDYNDCEFKVYSDEEISLAYSILSSDYVEDYLERIKLMAYEIAKYRYPNQYEYNDEQINGIIEEFS